MRSICVADNSTGDRLSTDWIVVSLESGSLEVMVDIVGCWPFSVTGTGHLSSPFLFLLQGHLTGSFGHKMATRCWAACHSSSSQYPSELKYLFIRSIKQFYIILVWKSLPDRNTIFCQLLGSDQGCAHNQIIGLPIRLAGVTHVV